ncbi:MAG TPA: hypothetical protein GXX28_02485, partial [Firmicutes bacterium]|nr:hypothetical protein [Bacillota bacterium]
MRRKEEGRLLAGAFALVAGAAALLGAARPDLAASLLVFVLVYFVCFLVAHALLGRFRPEADQYLLPLVALVAGLGLVTLFRLRPATAWRQLAWTALGLGAAVGLASRIESYRWLSGHRYLAGVAGLGLA